MRDRLSGLTITAAIAVAAAGALISGVITRTQAEGQSLKTPWGEPNIQGTFNANDLLHRRRTR